MKTRYCKQCNAYTPWNKAENLKDSPYICEGCGIVLKDKELGEKLK